MSQRRSTPWASYALLIAMLAIFVLPTGQTSTAYADHTPVPASVTLVGSLQNELGCAGDWDPTCAASALVYDATDQVWAATFNLPAGDYEFKVALNGSWDENYGANGAAGGNNIALNLAEPKSVSFLYSHETHWITSDQSVRIVTAAGSFQSELGCPGDWQPDCLRSWLQDVDGDGVYTFETTALPQGAYEAKAAMNQGWAENYGQNGVADGANIGFFVPNTGAKVIFRFVSATNTLTIQAGHGPDNNVEWDGLRHDSRDSLYRTPGGAVVSGTSVTIRLRTYHNDVTSVRLRLYDVNAGGQRFVLMTPAATNVSCYEAALEAERCDFWEATLTSGEPNNFWYRFIVSDGTDTDFYADNTAALDGGLGVASDDAIDQSYALMFYQPDFEAPSWAKNAVIYQIFPDRFRNGQRSNDPKTGDTRYDDPVIALDWGTLPEGYCRNYADANTNCPWRFDDSPPESSLTKEQPRGRDYYGGDLQGVIQRLSYLKSMGVTAIYFNPIFWARSNHRYDTYDYKQIDPALGTLQDFRNLTRAAEAMGMKIIVDSVFNHMSSDSPNFDRYGHSEAIGACESATSYYRDWFRFRAPAGNEPAPCAPSTPDGTDTYYNGWFGFDSIPEINKYTPQVQNYFLYDSDSVTRYWLQQGAKGWRLDVMGDASFPPEFWTVFRAIVKSTDPDALIIGELWQKDSTLLRNLRGQTADTTMNYRLRDAVLGLLTPANFDSKGFGDSGRKILPSEFASRMLSIQEDYPDAAYYSLMNLIDSHDTERALWTLTPGQETRADKEFNTANLENGKQRLRIASLIQYSMPGAPTVYYGDEVGLTGDDDPDDRRTYPWRDKGGSPDNALLAHYKSLANLRRATPAMTDGDLRMLLTDDQAGTVAYGRKSGNSAVVVVINQSENAQTVNIPLSGFVPNGVRLTSRYAVGNEIGVSYWVNNAMIQVPVAGLSATILRVGSGSDLTAAAAPVGLRTESEGDASVTLLWHNYDPQAVAFNVYRSPVSGGGWVKVNSEPIAQTGSGSPAITIYTDTGLENARNYYYVVTALDAKGNESVYSNETLALPHMRIGWANLQWPPSIDHTISVTNRTPNVYGQVWIDGRTNQPGQTAGLRAQLGYGPDGSDPTAVGWLWIDAAFNVDAGNNDEFVASLLPEALGSYDYAYRYTTTNGREWLYADLDGAGNGYSADQAGTLVVNASDDTSAPATPTGLTVVSASPAGVQLRWDAVQGDASLYGYEVLRSNATGGTYTQIARVTTPSYTDTAVSEGATYFYVVRALDGSFNRSGNSNEVMATAQLRTVTLVFNVTVPASMDATGRSAYIAGFMDRLDGNLPQWNPGGVVLTRVDATTWTITLTGKESTQIEYKYALGSWDYVEKDEGCGEIGNRMLTLSYGANGTQTVNDTVENWRNVAPCGN